MFTEADSIVDWIKSYAKGIKMKIPADFSKLEEMNYGHNFECVHNLEIDVINAETKVLHNSAHLFYEKPEVKNKLHALIHNFCNPKRHSTSENW